MTDDLAAVEELLHSIERFNLALEGWSNDEESDAACDMRNSALALLGVLSRSNERIAKACESA